MSLIQKGVPGRWAPVVFMGLGFALGFLISSLFGFMEGSVHEGDWNTIAILLFTLASTFGGYKLMGVIYPDTKK